MRDAPAKPALGLYLIATPIGAARDITLRALDLLKTVDVLAAEDTRTARKLLEIHGISLSGRRLIAYHDHSSPAARAAILGELEAGKSVAYMSEAGSPLIADPGYHLVAAVRDAGHTVTAAPGPSAAITALMLGGLATDRFFFAGFAPSRGAARRKFLAELAAIPATLIIFETSKRIENALADMIAVMGPDRQAAICRELTKKFEEVRRGSLTELLAGTQDDPPRGEVVVLIDRPQKADRSGDLDDALRAALAAHRTRDAADLVAADLGLPRRQVYQRALQIARDSG